MKIKTLDQIPLYRFTLLSTSLSSLILLSACGGGPDAASPTPAAVASGSSLSASQLSAGSAQSLSAAQAMATNNNAEQSAAAQPEPELGLALPGADLPDGTEIAAERDTTTAESGVAVIPATTAEPDTASKPTDPTQAVSEPATPATQPQTSSEPAPVAQAEAVNEPAPAAQAEAVNEPAPAAQAEAVNEPAPAAQAEAVNEPEPAAQTEAVNEPEPAAQAETVNEPAPAAQAETVNEPEPATEPAVEIEPATEPEAVGEPENATESDAASEPDPEPEPIAEASLDTKETATETRTEAPEEEPAAAVSEGDFGSHFVSSTTDGFEGNVNDDGSISIYWDADPNARGYNVFKQSAFVATVFEPSYTDTDTFDENYYYEIKSFDYDDNHNRIATGLTVKVRGTGRVNPDSPKPNENLLDGYELVFSDEFEGSELDSSKWVTQYLWGDEIIINNEKQHYVDIQNKPDFGYNPFSFDGEAVTINSIETPGNLLENANGQEYLSGVMTTYDAFKFTYGYVEARLQVPLGQGLWPAFWLLNAYYNNDKPEIDIMEFIGDNQDVVYHTYHYFDSDGNLRSTESMPTKGIDFPAEYHTYGVEWLPGTIIYYIDGIERHRVVDSKVSQEEMYIILNTALGGWWPGSPDETTEFPAQYKIDYVRAYQKRGLLQSDPTSGTASKILLRDDAGFVAPNHLPPFELFPEGYPEKAQ